MPKMLLPASKACLLLVFWMMLVAAPLQAQTSDALPYSLPPTLDGSLAPLMLPAGPAPVALRSTPAEVTPGDPYSPQALPCSINVACREGRNAATGIQSTVRIMRKNGDTCTGVLLNNTRKDGTPYVLTVHHCGKPAIGQEVDWTFQFNYQSETCADPAETPEPQSIDGATVVAAQGGFADFVLLRLSQPIPASFHAVFAGWSIKDTVPSSTTVVSHPRKDIKKITLDDDPLLDAMAYWVATFDRGTIENGSSGAPLFNGKQQVIGHVRSAIGIDHNACSGPGGDDNRAMIVFPKLAMIWDQGPAGVRVSDVLDHRGGTMQLGALRGKTTWTGSDDDSETPPSGTPTYTDRAPDASDDAGEAKPDHSWGAAYPNPFNPQTQFSLSVAQRQHVHVAVYDVTGRRVAVLFDGAMAADTPQPFTFEAGTLPSGVYLVRAAGQTFVATQTVTLMK